MGNPTGSQAANSQGMLGGGLLNVRIPGKASIQATNRGRGESPLEVIPFDATDVE